MTDHELAHWTGTVDAKLDAIATNTSTTLVRLNNHADRIASLEKSRHGALVLLVPFQVLFGAIVAYFSRKFGA